MKGSLAEVAFSVLTANLGNTSIGCIKFKNNLCYLDVERRVTASIKTLAPAVVGFQELLAPWQCQESRVRDPRNVCSEPQSVPQVRRILGPEYSIVCDTRNQFTCVAVRVDIGEIEGCARGDLCNSAKTAPAPAGCDPGFTLMSARVMFDSGLTFDLVNAHLQSTSPRCQASVISQLFGQGDADSSIMGARNVLVLGDFNLDPWRDRGGHVELWTNHVSQGWMGRPLKYHSGKIEIDPPHWTTSFLRRRRTVDFVVSNFAEGICRVLGASPDTERLDGGRGMDHRAVYGSLRVTL